MKTTNRIHIIILSYILLMLTGCIYHPEVQQGNQITQRQVHALHKNMSKADVYKNLGKPILINPYQKDRIVYVYTFQKGHKKMTMKHLFIEMKNDRLVRFWTKNF